MLLLDPDFSALHVLTSPEVYHFYAGAPLRMLLLDPDGSVGETYGIYEVNSHDLQRDDYPNYKAPTVYLINAEAKRVVGNTPNAFASAGGNAERLSSGILVGREPVDRKDIADKVIAIPGSHTTAALLLRMSLSRRREFLADAGGAVAGQAFDVADSFDDDAEFARLAGHIRLRGPSPFAVPSLRPRSTTVAPAARAKYVARPSG